jgi:RNA polymerase sigma-70 factor, ECF subfamily
MAKSAIHSGGGEVELSDAELVRQTRNGRQTAFDMLIRRYQRQAVAVAYRLLGSSQDAQEVTQDAFLKAFRSLESLNKPEAFAGWLMRIVSNLSLNYRRSRATRPVMPLDDVAQGAASPSTGPVRQLEGREMGQAIQWALEQLPEKQRLALVLFTMEGRPQKDVAQTLNCSVEAVKWHVFAARKRLRELLKDHL